MKTPVIWQLVILSLVVMTDSLSAEVFHMKNGDQVSGKIVAQTGSKVSVNTRYAGTIHISRSEIKQMGEAPVVKSGSKEKKLAKSSTPKAKPPISALDPTLVAATHVKEADQSEDGKFAGNINFALKSERGNNNQDEIDADFYLIYTKDKYRYHVYGQVEYDLRNSEQTKQDWQIYPTADYFISDKLYASLAYSAKQEKFAGLQLRQSMGPSIGYQFYEGTPINLKSSLGIYFVDEDYIDREDDHYFGPVWNMEYTHDLFDGKMQFYHRHYSSLSAEDISKLLWHSWTGIKVPVVRGIVVSAEFEVNYDGQPSIDADTLDTTLRLKLGYEW